MGALTFLTDDIELDNRRLYVIGMTAITIALIGVFCLGALLGMFLSWLYLHEQIEVRAHELYDSMFEWEQRQSPCTRVGQVRNPFCIGEGRCTNPDHVGLSCRKDG